jgi:formiminotetrahydrofolate cyclodeaminase
MKLVDLTVEQFINEVDSKSPAPGGGSVSALASSLGNSLARMVGHLTVGKKKFKELDEHIQNEFNQTLDELLKIKEQMITLIDKDTEAFNEIMDAFKLPKENEEEIELRKQAIENATISAIEVPLSVAKHSMEAITLTEKIKEHGNKNCLSDLGVSMLMLHTGLVGAVMNVKINLGGLTNEKKKGYYENEIQYLLDNSNQIVSKFTTEIMEKL